MEIQKFLEEKNIIPVSELTSLATDRRSFGDDVISAFARQIELRSAAAQEVLTAAEQANRDSLLASEQRSYDNAIRERDSILSLQRQVEQRTEQRAYVPATQVITPNGAETELATVLSKEQRAADWVKQKGGRYIGERGSEAMRFGRVVRAWATGEKRGLSDLELRVLAEGSDAAGGFLVPEVLGGQFLDRVRNVSVVQRAGATTVPMTSDTLHLARLAQPGVFVGSPGVPAMPSGWKLENDPIQEADLELERVTFHAHTLALLVKMSVELSEDAANIDAVIERELSAAAAEELDRVALVGSGTPPEPLGLINQPGVDVQAGSADYDAIIDAVAAVTANNYTPNAILFNSEMASTLAKLRDTPGGSYLVPPTYLDGLTRLTSNAIDIGSPAGGFFVGQWDQLLIGMRTSFRLEASRTAGDAFSRLQVWIRCYLRADIQLADPAAFAVRT